MQDVQSSFAIIKRAVKQQEIHGQEEEEEERRDLILNDRLMMRMRNLGVFLLLIPTTFSTCLFVSSQFNV